MRWNKADLVLFYFSVFIVLTKPLLGQPGRLNVTCLQSANRNEFKRSGTENYLGDNGSSPQETRIFGHVLAVDKERKNTKIKNIPMGMEFLPFYLKSNINSEKRSMFGYKYDIIFPRKEDIQKKYETQQNYKISPPVNPVSTVEANGEDEYHSKSSNRLESFHYNRLSPSDFNRNEYAKSDGKASDSNQSELVYFEENASNANENTGIETTTVDDSVDTTSSAYPDATEMYSDGVGYYYERPTGDKQFLLHTNVSQQETPVEGDREQSPSASSVREKIEYPGSPRDDLDILPRVSVIFQSSNFAEDGIPLADDYESNDTEPIEYNFAYSLLGVPEFSHEESRQQEAVVGAYHVRLPDGRIQLVQYQADQTGYKPKITYYQDNAN